MIPNTFESRNQNSSSASDNANLGFAHKLALSIFLLIFIASFLKISRSTEGTFSQIAGQYIKRHKTHMKDALHTQRLSVYVPAC